MNQSVFKMIMTVLLCGTAVAVAAEELDAALAAQKKKAQRRVYSEQARMAQHDLTVPRSKTEEEKALEKKLQEMDAQAERDARNVLMQSLTTPVGIERPTVGRFAQNDDKTWLSDAIVKARESQKITEMAEDGRLSQEMDRQKSLQAAKKENEMVENLLREQSRIETAPSGMGTIKTYELAVPKGLGVSPALSASDSSYMISGSDRRAMSTSIDQSLKKTENPAFSLFSPPGARPPVSFNQNPLQSTLGSLDRLSPGSTSSGISSPWTSGKNPLQSTPITPLQKIRKSSSIYQSDPFSNDHMPKIKSSIWE